MERHSQQPPTAHDGRGRARRRVPQPVWLQQRQYLRFRRPPTGLRTRRTPRGALRARWQRHRDRRQVQRQAVELAERCRGASRWRRLVHRPALRIMGSYEGFPARQELKEAVYRVDPKTARIELATDALDKPNGICFSHDYKRLYIVDTGAPSNIQVFDVTANKL